MNKAPDGKRQRRAVELVGIGALTAALGCSDGDAPKAWNALATCLAGKAAQAPLVERVRQLRLIQLANATSTGATAAKPDATAWPHRCTQYANDLYAALPSSGAGIVLKRKLETKLGCKEEKGSCVFAPDLSLLSTTTDLWDAAKDSGLQTGEAPGVPVPPASPPPVLDAKTWKSFSSKPMKLSGPAPAGPGRALVLLKPEEGRARPTACEFTDAFSKVRCFEASGKVPELPAHSLELVNDATGVWAAGLTEAGLKAYNLKTGEESAVRGRSRRLVRDGVAVEPAAEPDAASAPAPGAKPTMKEEGFVAVQLDDGKASKEVKLPPAAPGLDPISVGKHIAYLKPTGAGAELEVKTLAGGRLQDAAKIKGQFSGSFHSCASGDELAIATWGGRSGQPSGKATGGAGKTQVTLVLFGGGAWSKAIEATLPFDRAFESDLVCTRSGASIAWAQPSEGAVQVGRLDCTKDGCKSAEVRLPGVASKWWWAVTPIGEKVLLLWRSSLGETRLRLAAVGQLSATPDTLLFDAPDFGGPNAGELSTVIGDDASLLVFRGEQPVALRVGRDDGVRLLAP